MMESVAGTVLKQPIPTLVVHVVMPGKSVATSIVNTGNRIGR